ncbi:GPI ethanolamine phosphate transferase, stabilizing subunit-like [Convolutriloba macropyga]|uniref:GPI ethanolamine phosphate transferase, stabilizing subunit-like n=1 Tax=Convolutriloba macropyga TaxID=536237 RepID=UPI003F525D04
MLCVHVIVLLLCPIVLLHISPLCGLPFPWIKYPKETAYLSASLSALMQLACLQNLVQAQFRGQSGGAPGSASFFGSGFRRKKRNNDLHQSTTTYSSFLRSCLSFCIAVFGFHVTAIAFGAELLNNADLTLAWAVLMATLAILPTILLQGSHLGTFMRVFFVRDWRSVNEVLCFYTAVCVCVFSWLFAVPIPLDWDTSWQPWPRTCLLGAYVGYIVGLTTFSKAYRHLNGYSYKFNA